MDNSRVHVGMGKGMLKRKGNGESSERLSEYIPNKNRNTFLYQVMSSFSMLCKFVEPILYKYFSAQNDKSLKDKSQLFLLVLCQVVDVGGFYNMLR